MLKPKGMDKEHHNIFSIILQSDNEGILNGKFTEFQEKFYDNYISPIKDFEDRDKKERLFWKMIDEIKEFYFEMGIIANSQIEKKYYEQHFGVEENGR